MADNIKTIFLDIDGTLTNNFHIHTNGWQVIASLIEHDITMDFFNSLHGADTSTAIKLIASECDYELTEFELKTFIDIKNSIRNLEINKLKPNDLFVGVIPFLGSLKENNVRIVCCAITTACHFTLNKLGIDTFFSDFICGNNMGKLKSISPSCYLDFIKKNDLVQSECIVIDDDIDVLKNIKESTEIKVVGFGKDNNFLGKNILFINSFEQLNYKKLVNLIAV